MKNNGNGHDTEGKVLILERPAPPNEAPEPTDWKECLVRLAGTPSAGLALKARSLMEEACRTAPEKSMEGRLARLTKDPCVRLVLAGLCLDGGELNLRQKLRRLPYPRYPETEALNTTAVVQWLSGGDAGMARELVACLDPRGKAAAEGLIIRDKESSRLGGHVGLGPGLESLLNQTPTADGSGLGENMSLIRPVETFADLVLDNETIDKLRRFFDLAKSGKPARALFRGLPGLGKTLAARALAGELGRPMLCLETGKSDRDGTLLQRAMLAASMEGAVLLLDEFSRWCEMDPSRMSAATGILLSRMESFKGVLVATSNHRLDPRHPVARRFHAQISFKYPEAPQRLALWQKHLSSPLPEVQLKDLAEAYPLSGGRIRNAVEVAEATAGRALRPEDLEEAARGQLEDSLPWHDNPYHGSELEKDPESNLEPGDLAKLHALAGRLKAARTDILKGGRIWLEGAHGYKVVLCSKSALALMSAVIVLGKASGLKPRCNWLKYLSKEQGEDKSAWDLYHNLNNAALSGDLPVLALGKDDFLEGAICGEDPLTVAGRFLSFMGVGLLTCETGDKFTLPQEVEILELHQPGREKRDEWARRRAAVLLPRGFESMEDAVGRDCAASSVAFGPALKNAWAAALARRGEGEPRVREGDFKDAWAKRLAPRKAQKGALFGRLTHEKEENHG